MRTVWNIGIIVSILYLPWWLSVIFITGACFFVPKFYEAVIYGILIDALYGTKFGLYGFSYVFTGIFIIIFFVSSIIRRKLLW
ncbi:MAG: hypothetical protein Q7R72_03100 [bacterium]|nr:hypothetical protein [bacterium]